MTFPLAVGDDVMLIFSTRALSEWRFSSKSQTVLPEDPSICDISYPVVVPCLHKDGTISPSTTDVELSYGDGLITIKEDSTAQISNANGSYKINADGTHQGVTSSTFSMTNGSVELVDILSKTLTEISKATVNTMLGAQPLINKPLIQQLIAQLDELKE